VQEYEFELQVGDTLQVGDYTVTVVDIDGDEVSVRIDPAEFLDEVTITDGVVSTDG
jgi:sRNA-binding carbon storage regulator CsrA